MHDSDMIFFLKIRWKVWVFRIKTMYSTASLMREEELDLERFLKVEGIEPSSPWYYSRIFNVGHEKPTNFTPIVVRLFKLTKNLHHVLVASHDRFSEDFK